MIGAITTAVNFSGEVSFSPGGSQGNFTLSDTQSGQAWSPQHHHHHHHDGGPEGGQWGSNGSQSGIDPCDQTPPSNSACQSTSPTDGQNCNQSDCQPGSAQSMIDHGNKLVQQGEQDIQNGNVEKGQREINHGMNLIKQGTSQLSAAQQPPQSPSAAPSSSNSGQSSNPLSMISQLLQPLLGGGSGGGSGGGGLLGGLLGGGGSGGGGGLLDLAGLGGGLLGL